MLEILNINGHYEGYTSGDTYAEVYNELEEAQ